MKEALKLALEALQLVSIEFVCNGAHHAKKDRHDWLESCPIVERYQAAITAAREALEQPDYRAVKTYHEGKPVYVSQQEQSCDKCPWVSLTAEDRWKILYTTEQDERITVMQLVEAKLKERNT